MPPLCISGTTKAMSTVKLSHNDHPRKMYHHTHFGHVTIKKSRCRVLDNETYRYSKFNRFACYGKSAKNHRNRKTSDQSKTGKAMSRFRAALLPVARAVYIIILGTAGFSFTSTQHIDSFETKSTKLNTVRRNLAS